MKRTVKIIALTAVVGMLASSMVMAAGAATAWLTTASFEGQTYRRPGMPLSERPVPMPGIANDGGDAMRRGEGGMSRSAATAGPSVSGDDLLSPRGGSALVAPSGSGPMYSPKQQGDRQIGRLIKQLG